MGRRYVRRAGRPLEQEWFRRERGAASFGGGRSFRAKNGGTDGVGMGEPSGSLLYLYILRTAAALRSRRGVGVAEAAFLSDGQGTGVPQDCGVRAAHAAPRSKRKRRILRGAACAARLM